MMGKRLERIGEIRIVDETNGFGLESKSALLAQVVTAPNQRHDGM